MDNTNSKIITISFAVGCLILGVTVGLLMDVFASGFSSFARLTNSDLVRHGVPAVIGIGLFFFLQFNQKTVVWADEVVGEIRKIVWPSLHDTRFMTIVVCVMVMVSSVIISSFDFVSAYVINMVVR